MFFQISKSKQDNFPHNHITENFVISLDEGWQQTVDQHNNRIWFKGYLDSGLLSDYVREIASEEEPKFNGNFCVIKVFNDGVIIRADKLRSFPLWYSKSLGVTNLIESGETIWSDSFIKLTNDLELIHSKFDAIGPIDTTTLSFNEVVDRVDLILTQKVQTFLETQVDPLRIFLTGGIDTGLLFSYVQKYTDNYKHIMCSHTDYDYFYLKNHSDLAKFWGYNQIHHWTEPCVLVSGAPGDEFTARSPTTANLLLLHYNTSIPELLNTNEFKNCLHSSYYNKEQYHKIWNNQKIMHKPTSFEEVVYACCDYNLNDLQHWHLGNTLTWTPLRDLEIFKLFARLELSALQEQVMNSAVQIELIRRNNPKILTYLSTQKNYKNYLENLTGLLGQ